MRHEGQMPQLELSLEQGSASRRLKLPEVRAKTDQVLSEITAAPHPPRPLEPETADGAGAEAPSPASPPPGAERIRISPLARRTAASLGVDYSAIPGTGSGGRIRQADILSAAQQPPAPPPSRGHDTPPAACAPAAAKADGSTPPLPPAAAAFGPDLPAGTLYLQADVTELMHFRRQLQDERGRHCTVNDLVLKAAAKCLRRHPALLSRYDAQTQAVCPCVRVDLGMAVAVGDRSLFPAIREADRLGLDALSETARELARQAREGQLTAEACKDVSFTVKNYGSLGIRSAAPRLDPPGTALLGVYAMAEELTLDPAGHIRRKQVLPLSLTWDLRLLEEAAAARALLFLRDLLEHPIEILL